MADDDVDAVLGAMRTFHARAIEAGLHHGQPANLTLIAVTAGLENDTARHALGTLIRQHRSSPKVSERARVRATVTPAAEQLGVTLVETAADVAAHANGALLGAPPSSCAQPSEPRRRPRDAPLHVLRWTTSSSPASRATRPTSTAQGQRRTQVRSPWPGR
jgi:hypothetical protein